MRPNQHISIQNSIKKVLILAIDASTEPTSASISEGQQILVSMNGYEMGSRGKSLLQLIDVVLKIADVKLEDIEVFAVTAGPGKFTGIRNSLSTIGAFSATLNKPVVCVPTLNALAHSVGASSFTEVLLPAGKGGVFSQSFEVSSGGKVNPLSEVRVVNIHKLLEETTAKPFVKWVGKGAVIYSSEIIEFAKKIGRKCKEFMSGLENDARDTWCLYYQSGNLSDSVAWSAYGILIADEALEADRVIAVYGPGLDVW